MSFTSWQMVEPNKPLVRTEASLPQPREGEVLLKIAGCGVCHTDLGFFYDGVRTKSPLPLTLGHEISGTVTACGPGAERWEKKAVIVPAITYAPMFVRSGSGIRRLGARIEIVSRP